MTSPTTLQLAGRTVVVTGSSGGIGRAMARALVQAGAACVVHGNQNAEAARRLVDELRASGGEAIAILADLTDAAARARLLDEAWQWRGGVDVWVNNAGADVLTGAAAKWPFDKKLARLWEVDVVGTIELSKSVGQRMKARGQGAIINIGWDQAEQGMAGDSGELFGATKGAIMAFSRSLAASLAPQVRVNCVAPGWIKTSWGDHASTYWQDRARGESLRDRWGTPEDVAAAVVYLASPAADFINGHTLPVNGGFRHAAAAPAGNS